MHRHPGHQPHPWFASPVAPFVRAFADGFTGFCRQIADLRRMDSSLLESLLQDPVTVCEAALVLRRILGNFSRNTGSSHQSGHSAPLPGRWLGEK